MPIFRYFLAVGSCLLCLFFVADHFLPRPATAQQRVGSLEFWREAQVRAAGKKPATAIAYPAVAAMAPTAERLQWERQLTLLSPDTPVPPPTPSTYEARAEIPSVASLAQIPEKRIRKPATRSQVAARAARTAARAERRSLQNVASDQGLFGIFGRFN